MTMSFVYDMKEPQSYLESAKTGNPPDKMLLLVQLSFCLSIAS